MKDRPVLQWDKITEKKSFNLLMSNFWFLYNLFTSFRLNRNSYISESIVILYTWLFSLSCSCFCLYPSINCWYCWCDFKLCSTSFFSRCFIFSESFSAIFSKSYTIEFHRYFNISAFYLHSLSISFANSLRKPVKIACFSIKTSLKELGFLSSSPSIAF